MYFFFMKTEDRRLVYSFFIYLFSGGATTIFTNGLFVIMQRFAPLNALILKK